MNTTPTVPESAGVSAPGYRVATRPFYWSICREVWENHSIYIAPLIVSGIILFGSFVGSFHLPGRRHNAMLLDPAARRAAIAAPYDMAAIMIILTVFVVGFFYCLDALYGERRDRSVLFWKSLPVSDLTTVRSKATIPLAIIPFISFEIIIVTQFIMMIIISESLSTIDLADTNMMK